MNGTSLSNKTATVKSLKSKRLTDFLEDTKKAYKDQPNHEVSPSNITPSVTDSDKNSILNLEPATFETDEMGDETPVLFVGNKNFVKSSQNINDIMESYKNFKEMTSMEEEVAEETEFVLVVNNRP